MLELQHISYETEENREILHDISLTIKDRFVAITGPNGGGKSTLAKIIAGIYSPTAGRILLDGEERIIDCVRRVDFEMSEQRQLLHSTTACLRRSRSATRSPRRPRRSRRCS